MKVVTVADLCDTLEELLPAAVDQVLDDPIFVDDTPVARRDAWGLTPPTHWHQVPALAAVQSATTPVGAIVCPGTTSTAKIRLGYSATWRVAVAIYDRGTTVVGDTAGYTSTSRRLRRWGGVVRAAVLLVATEIPDVDVVTWVGENLADDIDPKATRTLGVTSQAFDLTASTALDLYTPETGGDPVVTTTHPRVVVRPRT